VPEEDAEELAADEAAPADDRRPDHATTFVVT
jgi:hypothetical protein